MQNKASRVAVVQAALVTFDTAQTLAKIEHLSVEAAAKRARLALFPEAFLGGYPRELSFGVTVLQPLFRPIGAASAVRAPEGLHKKSARKTDPSLPLGGGSLCVSA